MKITITICATPRYQYAMTAQARAVQAAVRGRGHELAVVLVSNEEKGIENVAGLYERLLGIKPGVIRLRGVEDGAKNYKEQAQLFIAQMRTAAFCAAREMNADFCWSLDSDVLPKANALDLMLWSLAMPGGVYAVATCPYPSQGGGGFLGGRGTPARPILPDFYDEERDVPAELAARKAAAEKEWADIFKRKDWPTMEDRQKAIDERLAVLRGLDDEIKKCPPKGNVFKVNAEFGWKRRGWFQNAYPEIGWGALVPSDWCGFGCTLMDRRALDAADFAGYDGKGTEDLFICWHRWHQAGMRINVCAHSPADHVIRNPGFDGKNAEFILQQAFHETEGECVGHLRYRSRAWYAMDGGEKFRPENDGRIVPRVDSAPKA